MQKLIIAGNVGKDATLRRTGSGDAVLGFSIAVDQGKDAQGNKRDTLWVDCSVWGKRAESLERHIVKGTKLAVEGRPTVRAHEGKAYLGLSVNDLTFMGGGERQDNGNSQGGGYDQGGQSDGYGGQDQSGGGGRSDMSDEVPF